MINIYRANFDAGTKLPPSRDFHYMLSSRNCMAGVLRDGLCAEE